MDPIESPEPIFIVDLNEVEDDGDHLPVSMDYTVNYGPRVFSSLLRSPQIGEWVRVHSDDDDTLYLALVDEKISDRDYRVKVLWSSCEPVLNRSWSARPDQGASVGAASENRRYR
jgi:hypothetical protein